MVEVSTQAENINTRIDVYENRLRHVAFGNVLDISPSDWIRNKKFPNGLECLSSGR